MDIFKYYGVDWIAMIASFLSLYFLGNKKKSGFLFGFVANISWLIFGIMSGSIANIVANVAFFILNLRGYIKWKK